MSVHTKKLLTEITVDGEVFPIEKKQKKIILELLKEFSGRLIGKKGRIGINDAFGDLLEKRPRGAINLKASRERLNISQKELAEKTGIIQNNISQYENGKRKITETVAKRFAKALYTNYKIYLK
jgi:DNA-binding XRE family transcriptional regulator